MAEEKKTPAQDLEDVKAQEAEATAAAEATISDKLKEAAGNITRASADARTRKSEQEKKQKKTESEAKARLDEAEKKRLEEERQAKLVAEQKLAALDYAINYRKKLQKDKERAVSLAKQKEEEAREEAARKALEEQEKEIAAMLEKEKEEAKKRGERATALLNRVTKTAVMDENGNLRLVDAEKEQDQIPAPAPKPPVKEDSPAPKPAAAVKAAPAPIFDDAAREAIAKERVERFLNGESTVEEGDKLILNIQEQEKHIVEIEGDKEPIEEAAPVKTQSQSEKNERLEEELNAIRKQREELKELCQLQRQVLEGAAKAAEETAKPEKIEEPSLEEVIEAPVETAEIAAEEIESFEAEEPVAVMNDEVVFSIKEEGKKVSCKKSLLKYLARSDKELAKLLSAVKKGEKALNKNDDENEAPAVVADVIKSLGKILEIRCDNLSCAARVGLPKYIKARKELLYNAIDSYNEKAISYAYLTGEQLTRVSAFLPDHLAEGTGIAVIPALEYRENYIEVYVDSEDADELGKDGVTTTVIAPAYTATELLGSAVTETKRACKAYRKRAKKADKKLECAIKDLEKTIAGNEKKHAKFEKAEQKAKAKLEKRLAKLDKKYDSEYKNTDKYAVKVARINKKYSKPLLKATDKKNKYSLDRKNLKLLVECFAIERERLVVGCKLLRKVRIAAAPKDVAEIKRALVREMLTYNKRAENLSSILGIELSKVSASVADELARCGDTVSFPKIAYRRELVETVGDTTRVIGDRLKSVEAIDTYADETVSKQALGEHSQLDYNEDKTVDDKALVLESIVVNAIKADSETVSDKKSLKKLLSNIDKAIAKFESAIKQTEKAMIKAADDNTVVATVIENLRLSGKKIELRCIAVDSAAKIGADGKAKKLAEILYEEIGEYNLRAIDYFTLTGEQVSRISLFLPEELVNRTAEIVVPTLAYKENYIEVYPKNGISHSNEYDAALNQNKAGVYVPIIYRNRRLTENRAVQTTVVNPPYSAEEYIEEREAVTWSDRIGNEFSAYGASIRLNRSLRRVKKRLKKVDKKDKSFDKKLVAINKKYDKAMFGIESMSSDTERQTPEYRAKVAKASKKHTKMAVALKLKRAEQCIERRRMKLFVERLVIERENLVVAAANLMNLRAYGRPNFLRDAKKALVSAMSVYNKCADVCAKTVGEPFSHISASYADEIVKFGKKINLPKIICCREIVESIGDKQRTVGDKHTYTMMGVTPVSMRLMMGAPGVGVDVPGAPAIGAQEDGTPVIGSANPAAAYAAPAGQPVYKTSMENGASIAYFAINQEAENKASKNDEAKDADENKVISRQRPISAVVDALNKKLCEPIRAKSKVIEKRWEFRRLRRRAKKAIKRLFSKNCFASVIKEQKKLIKKTEGTNSAPRHTLIMLSAQGCIADIRSSVLYAAAKLGVRRYVRRAQRQLYDEIDNYNSIASDFATLTGKQLTRISVLLPEAIASRTGSANIPTIVYTEQLSEFGKKEMQKAFYGELNKEIAGAVLPPVTAKALMKDYEVDGETRFAKYMKQARRADKIIDNKIFASDGKVLRQEKKNRKRRRKIYRACARYDRRLLRISGKARSTAKYQKKMRKITKKFRNAIFRIERKYPAPTLRESKYVSLECFALEQERFLLAAMVLEKSRNVDNRKLKYQAKSDFVNALSKYNKAVKTYSKTFDLPLTSVSSSVVDDIVINGRLPVLPKVIYTEVVEEILGNKRTVISKALENHAEDVAEDNLDGFEVITESNASEASTRVVHEADDIVHEAHSTSVRSMEKTELKKYIANNKKKKINNSKKLASLEKAMAKANGNKRIELIVQCLTVEKEIIDELSSSLVACCESGKKNSAKATKKRLLAEIKRYNSFVRIYEKNTGATLTYASTSMPDDIMAGRAYQTLPVLAYRKPSYSAPKTTVISGVGGIREREDAMVNTGAYAIMTPRELSRKLSENERILKAAGAKLINLDNERSAAKGNAKVLLLCNAISVRKFIVDKKIENLYACLEADNSKKAAKIKKDIKADIRSYNVALSELIKLSGMKLTPASLDIPDNIAQGKSYTPIARIDYEVREDARSYDSLVAELEINGTLMKARSLFSQKQEKKRAARYAALEAKIAQQKNKDLSVITKNADFEISMLESERDIYSFRFDGEPAPIKNRKKDIARYISLIKKQHREALRCEAADNERYYTVVMSDPETIPTKRRRADRVKLASLRTRMIVLLNQREELNGRLLAIYAGTEVNLDGASINQKWRHIKNDAAAHAMKRERKLAKRIARLPGSKAEKKRLFNLLNQKVDACSTLALCKYRLRHEDNPKDIRKQLKHDIAKNQAKIRHLDSDIKWMMSRAAGRRKSGKSWFVSLLIVLVILLAAVLGGSYAIEQFLGGLGT